MLLSTQQNSRGGQWAWSLSVAWLTILIVAVLFGGWFIEIFGLPSVTDIDGRCMGGCPPIDESTQLHFLGTDSLGRDVLSQLIGGARTALVGGIAASGLSFLIGYVIGSWSAWYSKSGQKLSWLVLAEAGLMCVVAFYLYTYSTSGISPFLFLIIAGALLIGFTAKFTKHSTFGIRPDRLMRFVAEVFSSVPALLLLLALAAMAFRPGLIQLVFMYVFVRWTRFAVLSMQEVKAALASPYIKAAYHAGLSDRKVLWHHILPNTFGTLWVQALLGVSAFIIIEGTFSFLGLGLPVEQASWGRLVSEARSVSGGWWLWVLPGLVLSATILSLQTLGDRFRQSRPETR
ncbi:MAG: ABC transporter permease [Saprospiraceae bacterium]